jgi:DNA-binding GntR family transcriptional regulator
LRRAEFGGFAEHVRIAALDSTAEANAMPALKRMPAEKARVARDGTSATAKKVSKPASPTEAATTLNEAAYLRIEEMIVTLELPPGSLVSESILSERLGIGTTPIREALQRLAREYLIQILPRRGVIVTNIDVRQQLQVLETRRELDRLVACAAARRGQAADRASFADIARVMKRAVTAGDLNAFLRADASLNDALAQAARNEIATRTVATLHSVSRRFWFFHRNDNATGPSDPSNTMRLHVAFAKALASGNESVVALACDALIDDLMDFARNTLDAS